MTAVGSLGVANARDEVDVRGEEALCSAEYVGHGGKQGPGDFPNRGSSFPFSTQKRKKKKVGQRIILLAIAMGKATKATRKFASSGQLKKTIQSRKKHQQIKKRIEGRRGAKGKGKDKAPVQDDDDGERDDAEENEENENTEFVHECYGTRVCVC